MPPTPHSPLPTELSAVLIGDNTARFRDPRHAQQPTPPFPALLQQPTARGSLPRSFQTRPRFMDHRGQRIVQIDLQPGTSVYGTGEVSGPLERRGSDITLWATDCFGYNHRTKSLYQSQPWTLAVRRDGSAFGVMVETTHRCRVKIGRTIEFACDGPSPAVIVIERPDPQSVVQTLAELTGYMPMPPKWALGYQQCRWSYEPESKIRELMKEFRDRKIPCDVIWLDIDYMNGFRCFTFDRDKFPNPAQLNADMREAGFHSVYMIDPGIKVDPGYFVYDEGRAGDHFVKTADHDEYRGSVWPGPCAFPDFTRERTRHWWGDLYREFMAQGIDGVWNDMNEPAVFDGPGKTMPESNRHDADAELGGPGSHSKYHNLYGMQMVRATREGIERASPDKRPFVLTRSNFLGGQRYAATWTGDNTSDWNHLRWSISMALNLSLSGQPFVGPDIGGFAGNADGELFARWMGIAALLPFARGHSVKDSVPHEPWAFGEDCEKACRLALDRRYRLIPYLYTLFHEAATTGTPIVRPVFFANPRDPSLRAIDHAYLLGNDVLVVADVTPGVKDVPVPLLGWREFEPAPSTHPALPRLFIRPGAIVPMGSSAQHMGEATLDELTFLIHIDPSTRQAAGTLYEDDGESKAFRTGDWYLRHLNASVRIKNGEVQSRHFHPQHGIGSRKPFVLNRLRAHWLLPQGKEELSPWTDLTNTREWLDNLRRSEEDGDDPGQV